MWVVGQDKISVANVDALAIDPRDVIMLQDKDVTKRPKVIRVWGHTADHDCVMGAYKQLDTAKGVLEQFMESIEQKYTKFEMPEDLEVA